MHSPGPPRQELEPEQACPMGARGWKGLEDAGIHGGPGGRHRRNKVKKLSLRSVEKRTDVRQRGEKLILQENRRESF